MALRKRQLAAMFAKLRAQGILRYIKKGQRKAPLQKMISAAKEDLFPSVSLNVIDEKRVGALVKRLPEKLRMEVGLRPHFSGETMPAPGMVGFYDSTANTVNLRATSGIYGSRAGYTSLPSHIPRVRKTPLDPGKYPGEQRTVINDRLERRNAALGSAKAFYHEYAHALQGKGMAAAVQTKGWKNIVGKEWTLTKGRTIAPDEAFSEAFSMYASTIGTRAALRKARPETYRAMEAMFEGAGGLRVTVALRKHKEAGLKIGSPEARAKLGTFVREGRKKKAVGQVAKALEAKKGKTYKSLQEMGEDITAPPPPKPAVVSKLEKSPTAQEVDLPALQAELNKTKAGQTLTKRLKGGGQLSRNEERTLKAVTERMQKRAQQTTDDAAQKAAQARKAETAAKKTEKKRTTIAQRLRAREEDAKKAAQKAEAAAKKAEQKAPKKPAETLTPEEKKARNLARRAVNARLYRERRRQREAGKQAKKAERKQTEAKKETEEKTREVKQQEGQVKQQKQEREFWKVAALAGGSVALAEALRRWYKRRQKQREDEMRRGTQGRP